MGFICGTPAINIPPLTGRTFQTACEKAAPCAHAAACQRAVWIVAALAKPCAQARAYVIMRAPVITHLHSFLQEAALNEELSKLISLQEVDVEIRRLQDEIASLPVRQEELERQFAASVKEYLDLKQQLTDSLSERRRLEADLSDEQNRHQKFKDDLNKMTAPNIKVYETIMREIDTTRKTVSLLETDILKLMEQIEKLEAQVHERTPEVEARRVEVDRQLAEWRTLAEQQQQRLAELSAARAPLLAALSATSRATYQRLSRMRSGLALAEARDYSCLACRMKIRPQVFADIRRGETIITCESCGRILYFKPETATT